MSTSTLITGGPVHNYKFRPLSNKGGKTSSYPWTSTSVGGWFFKAVSKDDLDKDKGRPAYPRSLAEKGIKWKSCKMFCEETKQYGYYCERIK
jgi:hypothetical protein